MKLAFQEFYIFINKLFFLVWGVSLTWFLLIVYLELWKYKNMTLLFNAYNEYDIEVTMLLVISVDAVIFIILMIARWTKVKGIR